MGEFRGIAVWLALILSAAALTSGTISAAEVAGASETLQTNEPAPAEPTVVGDRFGRDTPQGSMRAFFLAADAKNMQRAAEYLDLRYLDGEAASIEPKLLAEWLIVVLERQLALDLDTLSMSADGWLNDGLPEYRDQIGQIETSKGALILYLQHVPDGADGLLWKISNRTVSQIPELHEEFGYSGVTAFIKSLTPEASFIGIELFKWVAGLLAALVAWLPIRFAGIGTAKLLTARQPEFFPPVSKFFIGPVSLLLIVLVMAAVITDLGLGATARKITEAQTLTTILTVWMLLAGVNLLRDIYRQTLERQQQITAISLLGPIATSVKSVIVLLAIMFWLNNVGYEITALLAGLGVGGIAVALVLQKPLEDVFGAISLYTQQPVKVGDFCRAGNVMGTVEEISMRSTRIRTLANTLVAVPNSQLAGAAIDNFSARSKILYEPVIRLDLAATTDQVQFVLEGIRKLLEEHADVQSDGARVRFKEFGLYGLELSVFAYITVTEYAAYLRIGEELNLAIMDIVARSGTRLATPLDAMAMAGS